MLQRFFIDVMMWENELDRIVLRKGSLHELLNVGNSGIDDFMICIDVSCNVLAHTESAQPPDSAFRNAVETGRQTSDNMEPSSEMMCKSHETVDEQGIVFIEPTATHPKPQLQFKLHVEDTRFATLVLASATETISRGKRDLFASLAMRVKPICESLWRDQVRIDSPHHFFFTRLIEGDIPEGGYLNAHLETTVIPHPAQLKLILLDLEHAQGIPLSAVADAARLINQGDCYRFVHKEKLCVLCYAALGDNQLSHEKSVAQLERFIRQPFGIVGSSSQIFENIADLDLAYRQADMAANLRSLIEKEGANDIVTPNIALIPFENCLIYYLVGAPNKDERFLAFSFSHTLMQKISAEDAEHGTNYLEIFWQYLACERNATAVAEQLHLHRNTVLYRIDKIQKRFELDLSSQEVREKMIIDFKVFFLMQNRASIQRLFGKED